ncbi:mycothiol transferase [Gordonia sp. NPDC003425]
MRASDILIDGFGRIGDGVHGVLDGISEERLGAHVSPDANSIAWLIWHLTRVQDAQIADVAGTDEVWVRDGWYDSFALPFAPSASGYGQSPDEARRVVAEPEQLLGYHDATHAATLEYLGTLGDDDLDRIIDERWDPPVTLGVRLVSILDDDAKHLGQAEYIRGLDL